jgi:predicted ATP-grasp superfamily ATP-dependent carboligase
MHDAVRRELSALPGVEIMSAPPSWRAESALGRRLGRADAALVIAPEGHGRLARLARAVERSRVTPLGCGPRAARIAGDKLATARLLARAGVATPVTRRVGPGAAGLRALARVPLPLVLKPRDGCGADGVEVVRRPRELAVALRRARRAAAGGDVIAQPYVAGAPMSVSLLVRRDPRRRAAGSAAVILGVGRQRIAGRRSLRYLGGDMPVRGAAAATAARLALRAAAALAAAAPDLRGPLGVDLVLGDDGAVVIEMNPRLTTSWIGLRRIARASLGRLLLDAANGRRLPRRVALAGRCRFGAGGRVMMLRRGAPAARRAAAPAPGRGTAGRRRR